MRMKAGFWLVFGALVLGVAALGAPAPVALHAQIDACDNVTLFDFEQDDGGFTANTPPGSWEWGALTPHADGPPAAHSGGKLWGTNLSGIIPHEPSDHILRKTIDVPLMAAGELQWWDWWHEDGVDEGRVFINDEVVYFINANQLEWRQHRVDLTPWQGQTAEIRFEYLARPSDTGGAGWYVDDVAVVTCDPLPGPDLRYSTLRAPDVVVAGRELPVSVTVFNNGSQPAAAGLSAPLPAGTTFVDGSASGGATFDASSGAVVWQGTLPVGVSATAGYRLRATGGGPLAHVVNLTAPTADPVTLTAETQVMAAVGYPVCEGFESGALPAFMVAETTSNGAANGRVVVDGRFTHSGSFAAHIDTNCGGACGDGTFTRQAIVMAADLAGQSQVALDFRAYNHDDEPHPEDGVFISDDGGLNYAQIYSFNDLPQRYKRITLDVSHAAREAGVRMTNGFLIKLQSYDNFAITLDGMSFDDVCLQRADQPEISTDPAVVRILLDSDTAQTLPLDIVNSGRAELRWQIREEAAQPLDAPAAGEADAPLRWSPELARHTAESGVVLAQQARDRAGAAAFELLYDQTDGIPTTTIVGIKSQQFETTYRDRNAQGADDFEVPAADGSWTVRQVVAPGFYEAGAGPAPQANVFFYRDGGTLPGTAVYSATNLPVTRGDDGTLVVDLQMPALLPPGRYWVSVQAVMNFDPDGLWNWTQRSIRSGQEFAWRNPGGGWGTVCTDWSTRARCNFSLPDLAFQLLGSRGDCVAANVPWLQVSPASGVVRGDGREPIDLTLNTAGLADGSYRASLCVVNNDPYSGVLKVPVDLTVGLAKLYLPVAISD